MRMVRLGTQGPVVSRLSIGTWTFAGDALWSSVEEKECVAVIHAAMEAGVNLFDSAPNYGGGRSEHVLGLALQGRPDALVATKFKVDGKTPAELVRMVEESLRRLGREAIDIMQIHWPTEQKAELDVAFDTLAGLRSAGKIRYLGVCNFGKRNLHDHSGRDFISNQLPYSLMWRVVENGIAGKSKELGLGVIAYSPLQQGLLSGKYQSLAQFPENRKQTRHFSSAWTATRHKGPGMEAETEICLKGFNAISHETGIAPTNLALAYVLQRPFIDVALAGARSVAQLEELLRTFTVELDGTIVDRLDAVSDNLLKAAGDNPDMYQTIGRTR